VRFIATSKADLAQEALAGRFRQDLLYRLNVATVHVPSLAQRRSDIPLLFLQLVREAAARYGRDDLDVPSDIVSTLAMQEWPGNVRELRNAADRLVLGLDGSAADGAQTASESAASLSDKVAEFEKSVLAQAIALHKGNLKAVYETLGISRKTLYEKMQKHALTKHGLVDEDLKTLP
jgi:two-component system C4-dicarboxylate transport response regulator DctD